MAKFEKFGKGSRTKIVQESSNGTRYIDYRDVESLKRLTSPNGKILGRKRTNLNSYDQRLLAQAIKRARYMGLIEYTSATL